MSAFVKAFPDRLPFEIVNLKDAMPGVDANFVSDGYHTFGELYEHRIANYMALCRLLSSSGSHAVWMSKSHSDGSEWDGWFILGINTSPGSQITYHLPDSKWDSCKMFADLLGKAPEFDGHTSEDVLDRLSRI